MPRSSKRQTRLTFDPLPTSSPAPSDMSQSVRDRAATVRFEGANPSKRRKVRDAPGASSLSSTLVPDIQKESLPPTPDLTGPTTSFGASAVSDDEIRPTQRLSSRKTQKKQQKLDLTPSSPRAINHARPVRAGFFGTQQQLNESSDESGQDLPKLPVRAHKRKSKREKKHKSPSPEVDEEVTKEPATVISDDESEDDLPATPALNRKRKRQAQSSSPLALIPDDEDDDSDVVVTGSRKRSLTTKVRAPEPEPEAELSDEPPSSRSRKRLRRVKDTAPMNTITEEEKQELEDDLVDLASSGSDTEVRVSQRNKSSQKSARQLALERLKARRKAPMSSIVEDEDDEDELQIVDDEEEDYNQSSDEEEEDDELPEPSTNRTTRKQMFAEDEEDEGFVIDDDESPLGVPTNVPIAFTRYASMKAKDLFRFAIDWMVQKKINPAFQMDDEIYDLTFKKLDDEVKGLAGSKFQSAAWTSQFTLALQARPDLLSAHLDRQSSAHFMRDKCDACNRSGHPATYEVKFEGKPYDKNSLEPVAPRKDHNDSDSDSDEDDESSVDSNAPVNYDSQGRPIAPEETTFYLGKFCMSNAETAHSLQHWRYHLYEWVVEYLESAGWNTPKLIVKRDKWSIRKRRKHANKIVDIMEEQGKIKALYGDFKKEIDTARNVKQGRWDSSP